MRGCGGLFCTQLHSDVPHGCRAIAQGRPRAGSWRAGKRHDLCASGAVMKKASCQHFTVESLRRLLEEETAVATVEYAYLLGLLALGTVVGLTFLSDRLIEFFTTTGDQFDNMID